MNQALPLLAQWGTTLEPNFAQDITAQLARSDWLEENGQLAEAERLRTVCRLRQVLIDIGTGKYDQDLADIAAMVETRRSMLRQTTGQRVVINSRARPAYLIGHQGTVIKQRNNTRGSIGILLDQPVGRFTGRVWIPINAVDFI